MVSNILIALKEAKNLAAGYIQMRKTDGSIYKQSFATSELICKILFDVNIEDCHVTNISSALKLLLKVSFHGYFYIYTFMITKIAS